MTADEALDAIARVYGTPMVQPVREELARLRYEVSLLLDSDLVVEAGLAAEKECAALRQERDAAIAENGRLRADLATAMELLKESAVWVRGIESVDDFALLDSLQCRIDATLKEQKCAEP